MLSPMQKSSFVIPEVFIGNPVFYKIKDFWIPAFAGMKTIVIPSLLLQEALMLIIREIATRMQSLRKFDQFQNIKLKQVFL